MMNKLVPHNDRRAFILSVLAVTLPFGGFGLFSGDDFLIRFFPDDAFYYIQTAWNFSTTGKISFDGVNWTNGFHPLFFLVSSILTFLFPKSHLLNVFFLLNVFLVFTAIILCVQKIFSSEDNKIKKWIFIIFSLPPFFFYTWTSCGLEAGMVILITVLFFWAWVLAHRKNFTDQRQNLYLGGTITCLMMTRLDLILVLAPFILFLCYRFLQKKSVIGLQHIAAIFSLPLFWGGFYLTINIGFTGHVVPISGVAKSFFSVPFWMSWNALTGEDILGSIFAILPIFGSLTIFICAIIPSIRSRFPSIPLTGILLLNTGMVFFYLYLYFFASHFFSWYLSFPAAVLLISGVMVTEKTLPAFLSMEFQKRFGVLIFGCALFFNVSANIYFLVRLVPWDFNVSYHLLNIARKVDQLSGPDAVIGTFDAGIIGFFTAGRVINLDGLANNFDYLDNYLIPGRLQEYFTKQGITHFLARGRHLRNITLVKDGNYVSAILREDPRINLSREKELFRYTIPGSFTVFLFKLN